MERQASWHVCTVAFFAVLLTLWLVDQIQPNCKNILPAVRPDELLHS